MAWSAVLRRETEALQILCREDGDTEPDLMIFSREERHSTMEGARFEESSNGAVRDSEGRDREKSEGPDDEKDGIILWEVGVAEGKELEGARREKALDWEEGPG